MKGKRNFEGVGDEELVAAYHKAMKEDDFLTAGLAAGELLVHRGWDLDESDETGGEEGRFHKAERKEKAA